MRKKYAAWGAAVAAIAATIAATPATAGVFDSSDRSGNRIMLDPSADNTDLYASGSTGIVLTVKAIPLVG